MGVPAFFRWLSRKYPSIVVNSVEEKPKTVDGQPVPIDSSEPNPNDVEFDNLYLDMNGIIHPCSHPENKPQPKNEAEMMVAIFEYIDRIFTIVRPRKLLYMAIDGVAPRAKMNQQRSRRFRSSKDADEKEETISRLRAELESKGAALPAPKADSERFDSNCITPGTKFMSRLAECLRYYIHDRLNSDPGWKGIAVILSDANVPGEGEHKIMDFIRRQRAQPGYDSNTHHCLCGADADLIMLGLATHEPHFTIIREEFKPNKPRPCDLCGQYGHEVAECTGLPKEKQGEFDELNVPPAGTDETFIFIRLSVAREYLEREMVFNNLPFPFDFERLVDDWVFMNFFVGNDFLPHLPSLEIREGAIDRLVRIYKDSLRKTGGYLTEDGIVNLSRVQVILNELGKVEDEIFKKRREQDLNFRRRDRDRRKRSRTDYMGSTIITPSGGFAPRRLSDPATITNARQSVREARAEGNRMVLGQKRDFSSASGNDPTEEEDEDANDAVRLWEDGWKDRYYKSKFDVGSNDLEFRYKVANHYVRGLCWVLQYYYQGCPSWKWFFPYHYAPFASDFVNIGALSNRFEKHTKPFKPLEQLMGVFPAASRQFLPSTWQRLMTDAESPIIDFYPTDFKLDLNGKKFAWQGVALLPFVDEIRLKNELSKVYDDLTDDEQMRNSCGNDRLFVGQDHPLYSFLGGVYEGSTISKEQSISLTEKIFGHVWSDDFVVPPGDSLPSPVPDLPALQGNSVISAMFEDPKYGDDYLFKAQLLKNVTMPSSTLKPAGMDPSAPYRPVLGFSRNSGYRDASQKDPSIMQRVIRHNTGPAGGAAQYQSDFRPRHQSRFGNPRHSYSDCTPQGQYSGYQSDYRPRYQSGYGNPQHAYSGFRNFPHQQRDFRPRFGDAQHQRQPYRYPQDQTHQYRGQGQYQQKQSRFQPY